MKKKEFIELTKKHFNFLVDQYGFLYNETPNMFHNTELCIYVKYDDLLSPTIELWLKSEPEFTCLDLRWILHDQIDRSIIDKNLMADNFLYYSNLFNIHAHYLIYELNSYLLPSLKRVFNNMIKTTYQMEENISSKSLSFSQIRMYEYIKEKDPEWHPFSSR